MFFTFTTLNDTVPSYRLLERRYISITLVILLLLLSGCMQKVKVTYVPRHIGNKQFDNNSVSAPNIKNYIQFDKVSISSQVNQLDNYFRNWKGVRYRYGGHSLSGVDCSGLTQRAYKDLYGVELPRTVVEQSRTGEKINKKSLRPGDLVFFKTGLFSRHVGIYLGKNRFIHASRSKGVTKSDLNDSYWSKKYWQAKRYSVVNS